MRTWHIEAAVMAAVLAVTVLVTGNQPIEWVGACAVFVMTRRVSVANRMQESEASQPAPSTDCYPWFQRYLVFGECLWTVYFLLLGAYSALVGVALMLLYPVWRRFYRRWKPRDR